MRIGVDYRILSVGKELLNRGICRYTQQQLRAVLAMDAHNEYVLLCNTGNDLFFIDPAVRQAPNVEIRHFAAHLQEGTTLGDTAVMLRQAEEYQDWISHQDLDLFHATAAFHFERPVLTDFDVCPMVASFYDVIPLIYPDHYLSGWWREQYLRTSAFLRRADRMIAISEAAKTDATVYLGFRPERIDVAWPIPDDCFRPLSPDVLAGSLARLRTRIPLPDSYVLTVSHLHHTKNLQSLLRGYALLPAELRARLPLVVACHLDPGGASLLAQRATELGIAANVVMTGLTTDEELAVLYNAATVLVHPSRYEGFGLPVIEAMRCGTPVVTTTASSLPEAGGDAALLVDPDDIHGFARAIEALEGDEDRRWGMSAAGLEHATRFNPEQLGRTTLACYQAAVDTRVSTPPPTRPHLAVWTPLPPQQSGIADYSVELLGELARSYDIEVFVDEGYVPPASLLVRHRVHHYSAFERRHAERRFDAMLYQMGVSLYHLYMYEALRQHPGVVTLHDLSWSNVLYTDGLYKNDFEPFRRHLEELEGAVALREFDRIMTKEHPERQHLLDRFLAEHRMLRGIVGDSLVQVVHVPEAVAELEALHPEANVITIPMGVSDPYVHHGTDGVGVRASLDIPASAFLLGTFGIVHPTKRIETCVRALAQLSDTRPDMVLLIVGRALEEHFLVTLRELAGELGVLDRIRFAGHVTRREFDQCMLACDAIVNLRTPTATHMSAVLVRAVAAGKPLIASDLPAWRQIPEEVCLRVPEGEGELPALVRQLRRLVDDDDLRRSMSASARHYYRAEGTAQRMAARYAHVLDTVVASGGSATPSSHAEPVGSMTP